MPWETPQPVRWEAPALKQRTKKARRRATAPSSSNRPRRNAAENRQKTLRVPRESCNRLDGCSPTGWLRPNPFDPARFLGYQIERAFCHRRLSISKMINGRPIDWFYDLGKMAPPA